MRTYLDIVERVLTNGRWKGNRTGIRTLALPNVHFSHDICYDEYNDLFCRFPLLTTKKVAFKTMCVELEGFIKGITSKKWYQDRHCKIWDEWANPMIVRHKVNFTVLPDLFTKETKGELRKKYQREVDDLGPIYGYQWRNFNMVYDEDDDGCVAKYDQFKDIVDKLHNNPDDRRMVCSAWNPIQISRMALPPCHLVWVVTVIDGILNLHWTQRSCDLMLGVPFNIASYGLLMCLLCQESGLKPGNLSGMLCDCHIYENQIGGAKEQIKRKPKNLPSISLNLPDKNFDIFKWEHTDICLNNYNPHTKINFVDVAV